MGRRRRGPWCGGQCACREGVWVEELVFVEVSHVDDPGYDAEGSAGLVDSHYPCYGLLWGRLDGHDLLQ